VPWCAFIDGTRSLYAPAVEQAGIDLERLLVVRPPAEALSRVTLKIVESRSFAAVFIDLTSFLPFESQIALQHNNLSQWGRNIRRLALAIENTSSTVFLMTNAEAFRGTQLPVALRLELSPEGPGRVQARVAKERRGQIGRSHHVAFQSATGT
jgi:recombination protein RecA